MKENVVAAEARPKNRNTYDIVAEVLQASLNGAKKTRILYASNLSVKTRNYYLEILQRDGLLVLLDGRYSTTPQGKHYLDEYRSLRKYLE